MDGFRAKVGDTIEVVRGRKYPIGTRFIVTGFSEYEPSGCYGHNRTYYCNFEGGRIDKCNVKIVKSEDED